MSRKKKNKRSKRRARSGYRKNTPKPPLPAGFSTPVIKHFELQNPLAGLTDAQCRELFGSIGREAAIAFKDSFRETESLVRAHDPTELLATAAFYTLLKGVGPETDYTEDGPYPQAIVEVVQSVCLRFPREQFGSTPVLHNYLFQTLDLAKKCSEEFCKQRFTAYESVPPNEKALLLAVEGARLHTQMMRNWGYPQHMRLIIQRLFAPLEADIANASGVGAVSLLTMFDTLRETVSDRAFRLLSTLGDAFRSANVPSMVQEFCRLTSTSAEDEQRILEIMRDRPQPPEQTRFFLLSYFHQFMAALFTFTLDDCLKALSGSPDRMRVKAALDQASFQFGDLAGENPEHLMMQSKIRFRPLIKVEEEHYFIPIVGLLNSFFVELVEKLIGAQPDLKNRYHKRRAAFLEDELSRVLGEAFPGCPVHSGTTGISPIDGKEFENDCFVVVGPVALVFEAKSERVDDVARRGGIKTLQDHYETLVGDPAKQGERFARILEEGKEKRTFQTKKQGPYELDLSQIRRAICVSVTLDWFPAPTLCWRQLLKSSLVSAKRRPAVNLSLADLIVVMEVLERPAVRLHYFWRRIEWEANVDYLADEEDLLVYYLSEGLVIPKEVRDGAPIHLYGNSDQLHRHYLAAWVDQHTTVPRPRRILTSWWSSMVSRVEANPLPGKWDIVCVLLDVSFEQQGEFESRFERVVQKVREQGNDCGENALIFFGRESESEGAIVGFAYRDLSTEERNNRAADLAGQVQQEHRAKRVVVIGREVNRCNDPYDFLAFTDALGDGRRDKGTKADKGKGG